MADNAYRKPLLAKGRRRHTLFPGPVVIQHFVDFRHLPLGVPLSSR